MSSQYDNKDLKFVKGLHQAMSDRFEINGSNNEGVARYGRHEQDNIFPKVFISNDEIKEQTGRAKLRDSTKEKIVKNINHHPLFKATLSNKGMFVEMQPNKEKKVTEFDSFKELQNQNKLDKKVIGEDDD